MAQKELQFTDFVMKQKPLIDAEVQKSEIIKGSYTEKEHDMMNALLYVLQTKTFNNSSFDFWNNQNDIESRTFAFAESDLRKLAGIKDNSSSALKDIIRSLRDKRVEVKNFTITREIDGKMQKVKQHYIGSMIESAVFEKIGKVNSVKLQLSPLFVLLARRDYNIEHGNFALIPHKQTKDISGVVGKRLIEWCSKFEGQEQLLRLNEEVLKKICNEQPAFAHYKKILKANISKLSNLVDLEITTWNSKLKFCEIKVIWKIQRPTSSVKESPLDNLGAFTTYIRKNHVNNDIFALVDSTTEEKILLSVNDKGLLYNKLDQKILRKDKAKKLWAILFDLAKADKLLFKVI
jgi:hypothetical protein